MWLYALKVNDDLNWQAFRSMIFSEYRLKCWSVDHKALGVSESLEYSVQAFWRSIATDPIHFHFMEKLSDLAKSAFLFKIAYVI